ncbi:MAG: glutamate racemase [Clostridia bacterium]
MDTRPIGFLDSGLGGISVLRSAVRQLPHEDYLYYGDNGNAPYGDKAEAEITRLTLICARALVQRNVKAIVLACNTATATCIETMRDELDLPVVSVEPAIKPACSVPGNGRILMMATLATTHLKRYLDLQSRMPDPSRVINVPCPGLVDRIEQGIFRADAFDDLLNRYLYAYSGIQIDGIVLGCTHYIFVKQAIARYAKLHFKGPCRIYDGNDATALQLDHILQSQHLQNDRGSGKVVFLTSGEAAHYQPIFNLLFQQP